MSDAGKPSEKVHVILAIVLIVAMIGAFAGFTYFVRQGSPTVASGTDDPSDPNAGGVPSTQRTMRVIDVTVVDAKTQQPIPDATVSGNVVGNVDAPVAASPDGHFKVEVPPNADWRITITARAPDRASLAASWAVAGPLPPTFTFPLSKAATIGGQVVDAQGQPVPGATVAVYLASEKLTPPLRSAVRTKPMLTDAQGRWSIPGVPTEGLSIQLGVYDLMRGGNDQSYYNIERHSDPAEMAKLLDGSFVTKLPPVRVLSGRVVDSDGKPVPNASVSLGGDARSSNTIPEVRTDGDGRYQIGIRPDAQISLTYRAAGYAPETKTLTNSADVGVVSQTLVPGATIRGRVVDSSGKPIARAQISVDQWRGSRSLNQTLTADGSGNFVWHDAPTDGAMVTASMRGYATSASVVIKPDQDNVITLTPPVTFVGTVIDADTKQPIKKYTPVVGIAWSEGQEPQFMRGNNGERGTFNPDGTFSYTFTYPYPSRVVQVEADGYAPLDSPAFSPKSGNQTFTFELHKDAGINGTLKDPDGKPVGDVTIYLSTGGGPMLQLQNGVVPEYAAQQAITTKTSADGTFHLPSQSRDYQIAASCDQGFGYARRDAFQKSSTLAIERWAKVTGVVFIGSKPAARAEVTGYSRSDDGVYRPDRPQLSNEIQAQTDDQGRFTIDRVAPGQWMIGRNGTIADRSTTILIGETIVLKAGESAELKIGGSGRPLVGTIELPPELKGRSDVRLDGLRLSTHQTPPPWSYEKIRAMTPEQRQAFMESDEFKQYQARQVEEQRARKTYAARLNADGTFRFDDVATGTYDIEGQAYRTTPERPYGDGSPITLIRKPDIEVVAGDVDTPIALPTINAEMYHPEQRTPAPAATPSSQPATAPATQATTQP